MNAFTAVKDESRKIISVGWKLPRFNIKKKKKKKKIIMSFVYIIENDRYPPLHHPNMVTSCHDLNSTLATEYYISLLSKRKCMSSIVNSFWNSIITNLQC